MANWMSARWLAYLQREMLLVPMTPGEARSAERGEADLRFAPGTITARVRVGEYGMATATLKIKPLGAREWRRIEAAIAQDPEAAQRLLTGSPGPELEGIFTAAGSALFPPGHGRRHHCTCTAHAGCRHQRVLAVRAGRLFDANPFLWLQVLGRSRAELLAAVRAHLANQADTADPPTHLNPDRFLATESDPGGIPVSPGATVVPDALLRLLGPLPLPAAMNRVIRHQWVEVTRGGRTLSLQRPVAETAEQVLARYYAAISRGAAALAAGDRLPGYSEEPVPGKRIPLRERLMAEVTEALDQAGACLSLDALIDACPTAAALPPEVAAQTLGDVVDLLPRGYLTLADRYVGHQSALLSDASFRHVVTWGEWQRGRPDPQADWARALSLARYPDPVGTVAEIFAELKPEVGDELWITVVEPFRLRVRLRPRTERGLRCLLESLPADQTAARFLAQAIFPDSFEGISEERAVELLLAEGFYRPGRSPDPAWLLPFPAVGEGLRWAPRRRLTTSNWGWAALAPGGMTRGQAAYWPEGPRRLAAFRLYLSSQGASPKEVQAAVALAEAWGRHWPGNQQAPATPPPLAAFLHFVFNEAPGEARRLGLGPEAALSALAGWFQFLTESAPAMGHAYGPFLTVCDQVEPFRHRLQTLPEGWRGPDHQAWVMEGFRWLGPEFSFGQ